MLHRILLIAKRDYVASVMRKAFLIGLVLRALDVWRRTFRHRPVAGHGRKQR